MQTEIPLYSSDGELRDWITQDQAAHLHRLGLIHVARRRKGRISRCVFLRRPGDPCPMRLAEYLGTRYSFCEHLDNGHRCWRLRRLDGRDEDGGAYSVVADAAGDLAALFAARFLGFFACWDFFSAAHRFR
jgi:hypothetical protein